MVAAEGKKSLGRFPFGQTNRRALRLQAQGATVAPSGARRNPTYAPRPCHPRIRYGGCTKTNRKKAPPGWSPAGLFCDSMVEAAGIEPASASTLQTVLHT